jgi:predicted RND superfamily exporter protein
VTGLPEIVSRLNQVVFDGEPSAYRIPQTRAAIAQELLLYENDERNDLELLVDNDYQTARITARAGMPSVVTVGETIAALETSAQEILGDSAQIEGVGYMAVYVRVIKNIAITQVSSFGTAIVLISLALMLFLRSFRLGLLALVPNILPVAMILGFMGFCGINLDVATVLIASIVIGLAVNDTTHMFFRFREELVENGLSAPDAVRATMRGTGRAIVASSLILAAGFFVLVFASVKSISTFGLLTMVATLFALLADLVVTPALLVCVRFPATEAARLGRLGADTNVLDRSDQP